MAVKAMATITLTRIEIGGRNLLVQHTITEGQYLTSTGGVTTSATWFYTDYIPVAGYTQLTTSGYTNLGSAPSVVYYDADYAFVKGINNAGASKAKEITIDPGIAYIRFSGILADLPTLKIEKGNTATDWTEAPEDTQAKIDETTDAIQDKMSEFVTVDGYSAEIGEINSALQDYKAQLEAGEISRDEAITEIVSLVEKTAVIESDLGEFTQKWNFLDTSITFGDEGILVGDIVSNTGIRISAGRIDFVDNGSIVAEITGQLMKINRGIFVKSAQIGEHQIETIAGGHTIWSWIPS